ncbi:MAG: type II toxin-antitoxin system VapC family toxin [Planktothrix sp.]
MSNIYFLDTSYIVALEIKNEDVHSRVLDHWLSLMPQKPNLVTTTYIFDEVVTLLNSRKLHNKAIEVGTLLLESPDILLVEIDQALFAQGWQDFKKYKDKSFSLTDCLSFVVMREKNIMNALTLDLHFQQVGFQVFPRK